MNEDSPAPKLRPVRLLGVFVDYPTSKVAHFVRKRVADALYKMKIIIHRTSREHRQG